MAEACLTCKSLSGERRISPGPSIHEGQFWVVEHAYPTALRGWLVIVLKRHAEALHDLSGAEFAELAHLQAAVVRALREVTACQKEYLMCLAEAPGHQHIHFHVVPRAADQAPDHRGAAIFSMIKVAAEQALPPDEVDAACRQLRSALKSYV